MIAEGLSTLSNSMRNARENYQATKRSMQQGVDNLANDVRYTGRLWMKTSFLASIQGTIYLGGEVRDLRIDRGMPHEFKKGSLL